MKDPYAVLGVARDVSVEELKQSYRKLAKKLHPDLNPGDSKTEQRFKEVTAAYELLSDPEKRARYDRGEIDAGGAERGPQRGGWWSAAGGGGTAGGAGARTHRPFSSADDLFVDDIVDDFLKGKRGPHGRGGGGRPHRGGDRAFRLEVPFVEAALGAKKRVQLGAERTIEVTVPAGVETGQTLRLRGQGAPGGAGAPAGDALIEIVVQPHPDFTRKGRDVESVLKVSLTEALLGATVTAPTLLGTVALKVPAGSNSGTVLRLKGKGIGATDAAAAGDHYIRISVVLPEPPDPELLRFVEQWRGKGYGVR